MIYHSSPDYKTHHAKYGPRSTVSATPGSLRNADTWVPETHTPDESEPPFNKIIRGFACMIKFKSRGPQTF